LHSDAGNYPGCGCGNLPGVGGISFGVRALDHAQGAVADLDLSGLPVELEEQGARPVGMRIADGQELDDEPLSLLDLDSDFLAELQAVEKRRSGKNADIGISLAELVVFQKDFGIQKIAQQFVATDGVADFFLEGLPFVIQVGCG